MNRLCILAATLVLSAGSTASAQVIVRAPFVRVEVGPGGTYVRAPFVRYYAGPPIYVPPPPVYVVSPGISVGPNITIAPPINVPQVIQGDPPVVAPPAAAPAPAMPRAANPPAGKVALGPDGLPPPAFEGPKAPNKADFVPPPPAKAPQEMTIEKFAKSFQAKEGSYEILFTNPVSKMPTTVRFTLPPGVPDVAVGPTSITYRYVGRSMVKIDFDAEGATVTSR
jgi:hypothetical protein